MTKNGGKIILIWPCPEDRSWLIAHGFQHVILPLHHEMYVRFRSLCTAIQCVRRFYAHKSDAMRYILTRHSTEIPFSVLGMNPPRDYCELRVRKV
ncbi:hypothetical protein EPA93_38615 [Ktedonosporobacter rubrisoli]|uniref:Uncharacterized protein n=1 Tax=Ktedonosporobacter rubrisoli TaxID=2509675 RepID=A0A4P6K1L9_KTERU|nr:hypothetical protein [Ktedonosporobacter rubrisoli]QBD81570.1 hypothetical protein EPA93_38615 [Ktedonosporobacter rubrisoli]